MDLYILIVAAAVGFVLGFFPFTGFLYAFGLAIWYITGGIYIFPLEVILLSISAGGVAGWIVWLNYKKASWGFRGLTLWNAVFALGQAGYVYAVYFILHTDGFLGIYISAICGVASFLGLAYAFKEKKHAYHL